MKKITFRYKEHPGDFLRSTAIVELSHPEKDVDNFLLQFLPFYQSDDTIAFIDNLYKMYFDEFEDDKEIQKFLEFIDEPKSKKEIKNKIDQVEKELIIKAYRNFYLLVLENKIEILTNDKE